MSKPPKSKISIAHVFKTIIWPRKNFLFIGLFLIVISRLASLVLPWASKGLMDEVIPNKDIDALQLLILSVIGALIIQAATSYILTQILSVEAHKLIRELRLKVHKQVLSLPV
jgi:ABC-type bacteriocin/lantibiotic exporter with double-glycine peptidase domain